MRKLGTTLLLCLGLVFAGAQAASAGTISLADLISEQGTLIQGDKLFSDFTFDIVASGPNTSPADASGIMVKPRTIGINNGLEFSGAMFAGVNSTLDMLIGYKVSVIDICPNNQSVCTNDQMITDINLIFNGSVTGTGFTNVTETVLAVNQIDVLGQATVSNPPPVLSQTIDLLEPAKMVFIMKDIFLFGGEDGTATISFIDQAISQSMPPSSVPEPATLLLLGSGVLGLAGHARRKKTRSA